ncbi:MAG: group 1 truncated hemoglobin [Pyrinomonadaceae bacterium]|nr:group 1 truncated hemoglobin [Pyrinomonadaceae bacterium]
MKKLLLVIAIALVSVNISLAQQGNATKDSGKLTTAEKSLYERLGGYDALAAVTDDFLGRLLGDKMFAKFFAGASNDSKKKIRQHIVDFLCMATGGPCAYTGRDMKTAHTGLMITKEEWDASVKHLIATLDKFKVPEKEKSEVLTAVGGLEKDIVEKK